jgi:hypothetical protein
MMQHKFIRLGKQLTPHVNKNELGRDAEIPKSRFLLSLRLFQPGHRGVNLDHVLYPE